MAKSIFDILTVEFLKNTTILGVDLTLDDGTPFPDDVYVKSIEQAVSMVELDLGIVISPFSIKGERHDVDLQDRHSHYLMTLDLKPLKSVDKLTIRVGNTEKAELPVDYATIGSHLHSKINLIPTSATAGNLRFVSGVPFLVGDVFNPYSTFPLYFSIDYTAGFTFEEGTATIPDGESEVTINLTNTFNTMVYPTFTIEGNANNGSGLRMIESGSDFIKVGARTGPSGGDLTFTYSVNNLDPMVLRACQLVASYLPLNIAGDLIAGAGISQQHVGIDGLSQTISTTSSATNAGYGARLRAYERELKNIMAHLRGKYRQMSVYSR